MALIKKRLDLDAVAKPGRFGQFDVMVDGTRIVERGGNVLTRMLGAGYPDLGEVVEQIGKQRASEAAGPG